MISGYEDPTTSTLKIHGRPLGRRENFKKKNSKEKQGYTKLNNSYREARVY